MQLEVNQPTSLSIFSPSFFEEETAFSITDNNFIYVLKGYKQVKHNYAWWLITLNANMNESDLNVAVLGKFICSPIESQACGIDMFVHDNDMFVHDNDTFIYPQAVSRIFAVVHYIAFQGCSTDEHGSSQTQTQILPFANVCKYQSQFIFVMFQNHSCT